MKDLKKKVFFFFFFNKAGSISSLEGKKKKLTLAVIQIKHIGTDNLVLSVHFWYNVLRNTNSFDSLPVCY